MSFLFYSYSPSQIRQFNNAKIVYSNYIDAIKEYNLNFRYKMIWQNGYLSKVHLKNKKREYLGKKSKQTIKIYEDFKKSKQKQKEKLARLKEKLQKEKKLNKLEGINRAPNELVKIFSKINELDLDQKLISIGTNSLYTYESKAGVFIEQEHLSTYDIDILNKKDRSFSFIYNELLLENRAISLLQSIDPTFEQNKNVPYRFTNKDGVLVELINPLSTSLKVKNLKDEYIFSDVEKLSLQGIQWLENSRLFKEMVVGVDGSMAFITTIHPLEFAIYKNWLSAQEDRDFQKHTRDKEQSKLVTKLIKDYLINIDIEDELKNIKHLKKELIKKYKEEIL